MCLHIPGSILILRMGIKNLFLHPDSIKVRHSRIAIPFRIEPGAIQA
jgi:hypothetical protein